MEFFLSIHTCPFFLVFIPNRLKKQVGCIFFLFFWDLVHHEWNVGGYASCTRTGTEATPTSSTLHYRRWQTQRFTQRLRRKSIREKRWNKFDNWTEITIVIKSKIDFYFTLYMLLWISAYLDFRSYSIWGNHILFLWSVCACMCV